MGGAISVGTQVFWDSQAQGVWKRKKGEVVAVVAAGADPDLRRLSAERGAKAPESPGFPRDHVSYVVVVYGKTTRAMPRLYWPVASKLKVARG